MLYGKIYLDTDKDGRDMLVFVSLAVAEAEKSRACMVDYIAISPEAKSKLLSRLNSPDRILDRFFGDFEFFGYDEWDSGNFCFKEKVIEDGQRRRTLCEGERFAVKVCRGCRRSVLEYMIPCDNEFLSRLDLRKSIDENVLWERYYSDMRKRGEEPACDVETIKKTPPSFLTEAQKEVIRQDYRERYEEIDEYHRHHNPEAVDDLIVRELIKTYFKSGYAIEKIVGIT